MNLYKRIDLLPPELQHNIWSYNVEGHCVKMKEILEEFYLNKTHLCMRCLKTVDIKDTFVSFSAEYFFSCYSYGIVCHSDDCSGHVCLKRYYDICDQRINYYKNWCYKYGIEVTVLG
jgi:hypothetical protein